MVEGYQKDFEGANNRRIKYERDIAPIKNEYNRYKELKIELAKLEEMLSNKWSFMAYYVILSCYCFIKKFQIKGYCK